MTEPKLLNFILSDLLNAITVDEIVSNDLKTKELLIDGKAVTQNELTQLQAEIKAIEGFRIWQLMYNTTQRKGYLLSRCLWMIFTLARLCYTTYHYKIL